MNNYISKCRHARR